MFDSFISLGWFCGTASAMSKYGLREMSSPFDWCFSDLSGVMHFLETEFSDFMASENIQVIDGKPKEIKDVKWGIHFNHDIKQDYDMEQEQIREKYQRRIDRLNSKLNTKEKLCFIRAVNNQNEIKYIIDNSSYIERVITKHNEDNKIIFLIPYFISVPNNFSFTKYSLQINTYQGNFRTAMRDMFDTNEEFLDWCQCNYPSEKLAYNKVFDLEKEYRYWRNKSGFSVEKHAVRQIDNAHKNIHITESRFQRLLAVTKCDFSKLNIPPDIIIYGAGDIGKVFFDRIKGYTKVHCFIDRAPFESQYEGISIIQPESYIPQKEIVVVVIPTYDFEEIKAKLHSLWSGNVKIIRLEEFLI